MMSIKALRRAGLALLLVLSAPLFARAASEDGQFAVKGIGSQTCAQFTEDYDARANGVFVFAGWLDGYISALNRLQGGTFDAAPWQSADTLLTLIKNHCAGRPEERLFAVVHALVGFFKDQSLTARSTPVEATAGGRKVTLYQEVLRRAQEALGKAGVYSGTADGLYGPKTKAAFEAYQENRGLPKSGLPDQQTLFNLFERKQPQQ